MFQLYLARVLEFNYKEMREGMGKPGQRNLTATEKNRELGRD